MAVSRFATRGICENPSFLKVGAKTFRVIDVTAENQSAAHLRDLARTAQ